MKNSHGFAVVWAILLVVGLVAVAGAAYTIGRHNVASTQVPANTYSYNQPVPVQNPTPQNTAQPKLTTPLSDAAIVAAFKNRPMTAENAAEENNITMSKVVKGDLNGDGLEDAVIITSNCHICSQPTFIILNQTPSVKLLTEKTLYGLYEDLKDISISNGIVSVKVDGDGGQSPNPTPYSVVRTYKLVGEKLVQVS